MRPQGSIQKPGASPRISGSSPSAAGMAGSPKKVRPACYRWRSDLVNNLSFISLPSKLSPRRISQVLFSPQPIDPTKGGNTSEGVLANFFNSLLSKKPATPGAPGAPGPGAAVPPNTKPGQYTSSCVSSQDLSQQSCSNHFYTSGQTGFKSEICAQSMCLTHVLDQLTNVAAWPCLCDGHCVRAHVKKIGWTRSWMIFFFARDKIFGKWLHVAFIAICPPPTEDNRLYFSFPHRCAFQLVFAQLTLVSKTLYSSILKCDLT